jgi:type I restriction enzyme S subunit
MTEINNIPKHWQVKKLGEIFTIERGGSPRPIEEYITKDENGINWIKIGDTKDIVKYIERTKEKIKPEGAKRSRMVYVDDFLLSNSMSFGRPYIMKTTGCIHDGWLVIRKNEEIDNNYLYYILSSSFLYQQFSKLAKGSTVKNLNIEAVKQAIIRFPPLPEQQLIVSKIEELLSDLENGKQQLLIAQQQLKVYRQSLLKWAFEGKLTHKNVKDGELPEGWKWVKFGELFQNTPQNGLYKPSTEYGSGIPILRIDGFYDGVILNNYDYKRVRLTKEEAQKYKLSIDDIVVNRVNSMSHLGKCGLVKSLKEQTVFESNVMKIQINKKSALPKYIVCYLACSTGIKELTKNAKHAVNQASINQTDVLNAIIPLASISEQQLIVDELESKLTVCDKIEETISQSLLQAETLKQSILKKAFEGRLV